MESCDFICAMLQPASSLQWCLLEGLFAPPRTARVTTFFLSPCFYQTTPLRARSLLRAFTPQTPLGTLGKPSAVSVVIPLKSSYRNPFQGFLRVAGSSRFQHSSEPFSRRAFHPVAVLACREIYHTTPFCQFFSCCFCVRLFPPPLNTHIYPHIMNSICFVILPLSTASFFERSSLPCSCTPPFFEKNL